jgi:hypothetical protein
MTQPRLQSMSDIAAYLEHALEENRKLDRLLKETIRERITLHLQYAEANANLEKRQTEFTAREKLARDEFERRLQEIQTQFKRERHQLQKLIRCLKTDLDSCICKGDAVARSIRRTAQAPTTAPTPAPTPAAAPEPATVQASETNQSTANRQDAARARQQAWLMRNSK